MNNNNKKGFTIIEVVLVLAIAGLIFLMVFIGLPALQRSQRNTQRRQDMARIMTAFNDFQAARGHMPQTDNKIDGTELSELVNRYIVGENDFVDKNTVFTIRECKGRKEFCDPDGTSYHFERRQPYPETPIGHVDWNGKDHGIYYFKQAKCGGSEDGLEIAQGSNSIAIVYELEGGSKYCVDNS